MCQLLSASMGQLVSFCDGVVLSFVLLIWGELFDIRLALWSSRDQAND